MTKKKNITFLEELIEELLGEKGTRERDKFDKESKSFRLGVNLKEMLKNIQNKRQEILKDEAVEFEPYDPKDAVTKIDNYFFTFEYLDLYKVTIQEINANIYHIINNCNLPSKQLSKLNTIVEEANGTYDSYRKEEKVIKTEKEAEEYSEHLSSIYKLLEQAIELFENK
jgi:hypothetical protein